MADCGGESCGRLLADLGADVVLIEPPCGAEARRKPPIHDGSSLYAAVKLANRRSVVLDLNDSAAKRRLSSLLAGADIWIQDGLGSGGGFDVQSISELFPHLVILAVSPFGRTGAYRGYRGNEWTHLAMCGVLSRSGLPGREPLTPPGEIVSEAAAFHGAWVALLAYWNRLETGWGDLLDFSTFEAALQVLDPAVANMVIAGSDNGPPPHQGAPIFRCIDGYVRILVFSPRQWRCLRAWLGEPEAFLDPKFDQYPARYAEADALYQLIGELFAKLDVATAVAEGQKRSVPTAPVMTPGQVLQAPHYHARGTFREIHVNGAARALAPSGYLKIEGERLGYRSGTPGVGEHTAEVLAEAWKARPPVGDPSAPRRPMEGIRVLDLGVIVVGAESGRLFADQGADVIKVESKSHPDGARAAMAGAMSASFASSNRNKRSLGLNLRSREGREAFLELVKHSDIVLSNFKPGTMEALQLGLDVLRAVNPRIVTVESSAMGADGPWADWMGYGPLVRCVAGLTSLWRYADMSDGFGDTVTIYPDHIGGRVVDVAALAGLIARRHSGRGVHVESAQAEIIINALSTAYLSESLSAGAAVPIGNLWPYDAPSGLYPCAGGQDWCVVVLEGDAEFGKLAKAIGRLDWFDVEGFGQRQSRLRNRRALDEGLRAWTLRRTAREVMTELQAAGLLAGAMWRVSELRRDPHLVEREFIREVHVEGLADQVPMESGPVRSKRMPLPACVPSPARGEQTIQICKELLGLTNEQFDALVAAGALEPAD
jgi:crotonobetainyl-CoA:carnitine CoA-transferase CaiB-like acyl-CoA transferase